MVYKYYGLVDILSLPHFFYISFIFYIFYILNIFNLFFNLTLLFIFFIFLYYYLFFIYLIFKGKNMVDREFINFLRDRKEIINHSLKRNNKSITKFKKTIENIKQEKEYNNIVADYTEYNPLHRGHKYSLDKGKEKGLFISILPGPLERSGRGIPYLINRYLRAEMAVKAGADIVIEGPPMGIMGSGQYMQCIVKIFHTIGVEVIPRGYIKNKCMEKIIYLINK